VGPSALAKELNEAVQVVTNWGTRGVSKAGALSAQRRFHVSAEWVLSGLEPKMIGDGVAISFAPMTVGGGSFPPLHIVLEALASSLERLPESARQEASALLQAMTLAPDSKRLRSNLQAVLETIEPSK